MRRYGSSSLCRSHHFAHAKDKRLESAARKKLRKEGSLACQSRQRRLLKGKLDEVFSKLVRSAGKCARCGKTAEQTFLQCSHIYTRSNLAVRWDFLNGKCLCSNCHLRFWHQNPYEAAEWLKTIRTPEELAELRRRANTVRKWTAAEMAALLAELTEKLSKLN